MQLTPAVTLRAQQAHTFDVDLRHEFVNLLEVRRDGLRQLSTSFGAMPSDPNVQGNPGNANDNNVLTSLSCDRPCNFPAIWVGGQHVSRIDVSWRPSFAPIEYLVQGRNGLVDEWQEVPNTHLPNVSAFHPALGTDSFKVSAKWQWYRVSARMMGMPNSPNHGRIELIDVRFYGIDPTMESHALARSADFVIADNDAGHVVVTNISNTDREIRIQFDTKSITFTTN